MASSFHLGTDSLPSIFVVDILPKSFSHRKWERGIISAKMDELMKRAYKWLFFIDFCFFPV